MLVYKRGFDGLALNNNTHFIVDDWYRIQIYSYFLQTIPVINGSTHISHNLRYVSNEHFEQLSDSDSVI